MTVTKDKTRSAIDAAVENGTLERVGPNNGMRLTLKGDVCAMIVLHREAFPHDGPSH